jgi:hypothetical protein
MHVKIDLHAKTLFGVTYHLFIGLSGVVLFETSDWMIQCIGHPALWGL